MTTTSPGIYGNDQGGAGERTITVQIIAASAVVRAGLAALIGADERFEVLGSFATARAAQDEIGIAERPADLKSLPNSATVPVTKLSSEERQQKELKLMLQLWSPSYLTGSQN